MYLTCEDLAATVRDLLEKKVECWGTIEAEWGSDDGFLCPAATKWGIIHRSIRRRFRGVASNFRSGVKKFAGAVAPSAIPGPFDFVRLRLSSLRVTGFVMSRSMISFLGRNKHPFAPVEFLSPATIPCRIITYWTALELLAAHRRMQAVMSVQGRAGSRTAVSI